MTSDTRTLILSKQVIALTCCGKSVSYEWEVFKFQNLPFDFGQFNCCVCVFVDDVLFTVMLT